MPELVYVPAIVLGELHAGFRLGARERQNLRALDELLCEAFVVVLTVDREVGRRYGEMFALLKRAGAPMPVNDVWIAASTLSCGGHLLTLDQDFARVPGLPCTVLDPAQAP